MEITEKMLKIALGAYLNHLISLEDKPCSVCGPAMKAALQAVLDYNSDEDGKTCTECNMFIPYGWIHEHMQEKLKIQKQTLLQFMDTKENYTPRHSLLGAALEKRQIYQNISEYLEEKERK